MDVIRALLSRGADVTIQDKVAMVTASFGELFTYFLLCLV